MDQDMSTGEIYGIKMMDDDGVTLVNRQWRSSDSKARWISFEVPQGHHIIGVHGSDDGAGINSLGFAIAGLPSLS